MLRARYRRIVFFFARILLSLIFWDLILPRIGLRKTAERTRPERLRRSAASFRRLAVRMGGVMIKVGQFLSTRVDVLPPEFIDEIKGLQDEVPPEDFEAIRQVAEAELGAPLTEKYAQFERKPLAAAFFSLRRHWMVKWADALEDLLDGSAEDVRLLHSRQIMEDIAAYIHSDIDPVATTFTARFLDFTRKGVAGVNYIMVLNCMLSNMTLPIFRSIAAQNHDLPILATPYDGLKTTNIRTRLEAFVDMILRSRGNGSLGSSSISFPSSLC